MWLFVISVVSNICFGFLLDVNSSNTESMDKDLVKGIDHVDDTVKALASNYFNLLKTVQNDRREIDTLFKQNQDLNQSLYNTVDTMKTLITNEKSFSQQIQALQNITLQQQRELDKVNPKSDTIGFTNLNGNFIKKEKLLREKMRSFEKRIKQRINKRLGKKVDGQWSRWIDTPSSVTCGVGCRLRYRECSNPYPQQGGKTCTGSRNKHVTCQQYDPCPVHGAWSVWSENTCSVTCGVGTSLRSRTCSNPSPQYGGNNCSGNSTDHVTCTQSNKCPVNLPTLIQQSICGTDVDKSFSNIVRFYSNAFIHYDFGKVGFKQRDILAKVQNETFTFQLFTSEQNGLIWLDDRQEEDLRMYLAVKDGYLWFHVDEGNGRIQEFKITSRKIKELNDWNWHTFRVDRFKRDLKFYIDEEYIRTLTTVREIQLIGRGDVYLGGSPIDGVITQGYFGGLTKILYVKNFPNLVRRVNVMQYITQMHNGNGINSGIDIIGQAVTPKPRPRIISRLRPRTTPKPYTQRQTHRPKTP